MELAIIIAIAVFSGIAGSGLGIYFAGLTESEQAAYDVGYENGVVDGAAAAFEAAEQEVTR